MQIDGERLRELLNERGWTMGQLHVQARRYRSTLAWSALSLAVNGKRQPTAQVVEAIARALEVSPGYLLGLTNEKDPLSADRLWPADVVTIAERLGELPDETRQRAVNAVAGLLDAIEAEIYAGLSAQKRQIVDYFDDLGEEDQEYILQQVLDVLRRRGGDASSGARSVTK